MLLGLGVSGPAVLPHFGRTCPCLSAGKPVRRPDIAPPSSSHSVAPYSLPQGSAGSTWDSPYPPSARSCPWGAAGVKGVGGGNRSAVVGERPVGFPAWGGEGRVLASLHSSLTPIQVEMS